MANSKLRQNSCSLWGNVRQNKGLHGLIEIGCVSGQGKEGEERDENSVKAIGGSEAIAGSFDAG